MTAFAMMRLPDRILTAADGAMYMPSGHVAAFGSKMLHLPNASAVLVCAGPAILIRYVAMTLAPKVQTFEDVLENTPQVLKHAYEEWRKEMPWRSPFYMGIGGYSEARERFESYYIRSIDQQPEGPFSLPGAAWELMPAPEVFASPWADNAACERVQLAITAPEGPFIMDAHTTVVKAVAASRFMRSDGRFGGGENRGTCLVGGFIELADTMRDCTLSEIVHRWPDRVEELIDPEASPPLPDHILRRPIYLPVPADAAPVA